MTASESDTFGSFFSFSVLFMISRWEEWEGAWLNSYRYVKENSLSFKIAPKSLAAMILGIFADNEAVYNIFSDLRVHGCRFGSMHTFVRLVVANRWKTWNEGECYLISSMHMAQEDWGACWWDCNVLSVCKASWKHLLCRGNPSSSGSRKTLWCHVQQD